MKSSLVLTHWEKCLSQVQGASPKPLDKLAEEYKDDCQKMWKSFVGNAPFVPSYFNDERKKIAYLLSFHLANSARMSLLLDRVIQRLPLFSLSRHWDIWDFGCGMGAMSSAFLEAKAKANNKDTFTLNLQDQVLSSAEIAKKSLGEIPGYEQQVVHAHGGTLWESMPSVSDKQLRVFIFGYVFNELNEKQLEQAVKALTPHLKRGLSLVLLVDSSHEEQAVEYNYLRDYLVSAANAHPLYPCPHNKPCPLIKKDDWCYSEGIWDKPPVQRQLDAILQHPRQVFATSAYAFASEKLWKIIEGARRPFKDVLVGKPLDRSDRQFVKPVFCNKRGQLDKRFRVLQKNLLLQKGDPRFLGND